MKHIFYPFILSFYAFYLPDAVFAQINPQVEWQRCYGGTDVDGYNPLHDHMIIQTSDGGYVFVAQVRSNDGDVSGNHKDGIGNFEDDIWLVKTTSAGNILWQKCFGGGATETPENIIQTKDNGFLICGQTASHDGDVTNNHPGSTFGTTDAWVVKTDSAGMLEWQQCLGGNSGDEILNSVVEVNDGYIGVGFSTSLEEGWFSHGGIDAFIVKFNSIGEKWHKLIGGSWADIANSVIATSDNAYIFTGSTNSSDGDVNGFHGTHSTVDILTVKFDSLGQILWQKCYGGSSNEVGNCIISSPKGYLIGGYTTSSDGDVLGLHGDQDGWIVEIDSNGTLLDQHCFGGSKRDMISSIIQSKDGNFAFAGVTNSIDGDLSNMHRVISDSTDAWVGAFSADWELRWQKTMGGSRDDGFYSIAETSDDGFILNGKTESNNNDVVGNHGLSDIWNVKLSNPIDRIESANREVVFLNPYPNPSTNEISMAINSLKAVNQVKFYNLLGSEVFPSYHVDGSLMSADISHLPGGIYFIKFFFVNSNILQTSVFVHSLR